MSRTMLITAIPAAVLILAGGGESQRPASSSMPKYR